MAKPDEKIEVPAAVEPVSTETKEPEAPAATSENQQPAELQQQQQTHSDSGGDDSAKENKETPNEGQPKPSKKKGK